MEGTDPLVADNRMAFIEKAPRVRTNDICIETRNTSKLGCIGIEDDQSAWIYGPSGTGGSGDHETQEQYGFDPKSREWCDKMLDLLGYELKSPYLNKEFTKSETTSLLKLVCDETQKQANNGKDITELYDIRYKLAKK